MIRRIWPYVSLVAGLVLTIGSCVLLAMLDALPSLPLSTPYSASGLIGGLTAISAGCWLLARVFGGGRRRANKDRPVRRKRSIPPTAARRADRVQDTSARRARLRGGQAAGPRGSIGGGPAANNDTTEQLPVVDDEAGNQPDLTRILPLPAVAGGGHRTGWGVFPDRPSRSIKTSVRRSRGGYGRTSVVARVRGAGDHRQAPAWGLSRGFRPRRVMAAPAGRVVNAAGAATTVVRSVSSSCDRRVDVPLRIANRSARGQAAPVPSLRDGLDGSRPKAWTADGGDATATAGLSEIHLT